jgi:hypothetical protein
LDKDEQLELIQLYEDECSAWNKRYAELNQALEDANYKLKYKERFLDSDSRWTKLWCKILRKKLPSHKAVDNIQDEINAINIGMEKLLASKPDPDIYEIALYGGNWLGKDLVKIYK